MTYDPLPFFDCGVMLGPWEQATPGSPQNAAELDSLLKRCGIGEALAYSSLATLYSPPQGNEELLGRDRRLPSAASLLGADPRSDGGDASRPAGDRADDAGGSARGPHLSA